MQLSLTDKIIRNGTAQERALLLMNHQFKMTFPKPQPLLSHAQFEQLLRSFRTPQDVEYYDHFKEVYHKVMSCFSHVKTDLAYYESRIREFAREIEIAISIDQSERALKFVFKTVGENGKVPAQLKAGLKWYMKTLDKTIICVNLGKKTILHSGVMKQRIDIALEFALSFRSEVQGYLQALEEFGSNPPLDWLEFKKNLKQCKTELQELDGILMRASRRRAVGPNPRIFYPILKKITETELNQLNCTHYYEWAKKNYLNETL